MFPIIKHINDVLPFIEGRPEFIISKKDEYTVIYYVYVDKDSFSNDILKECRGISFDNAGNIIRRPLHKFFNIGEKKETFIENLNFDEHHVILEKLDGSQVAPLILDGRIIFATKAGETDISKDVEEFVKQSNGYYEELIKDICPWYTCIFEWCSRKNHIVIDYPEDKLILIAIRRTETGKYLKYKELDFYEKSYHIPVVKAFNFDIKSDVNKFIEHTRNLQDQEGYVIRWDSGEMVKIKADFYLRIHKAKDLLSDERKIAALILENQIDDIIPILPFESDKERVLTYQNNFNNVFYKLVKKVTRNLDVYKIMTRKEFALTCNFPKILKSFYFSLWDDNSYNNGVKQLRNILKKSLTHTEKFTNIKEQLFGDTLIY